jgi:hypothetical protein
MDRHPQNALVTICDGYADVEAALRKLGNRSFDLANVSVVGRELPSERDVMGCYGNGGRSKYCGPLSVFWEGLWEMLNGWGVFYVPRMGWVLVAGPFTQGMIAGAQNSALFSGLTTVGSALYGLGIPFEEVVQYEQRLQQNQLLLIIHGSAALVDNARLLLKAVA